jgi:hypothetical protein
MVLLVVLVYGLLGELAMPVLLGVHIESCRGKEGEQIGQKLHRRVNTTRKQLTA